MDVHPETEVASRELRSIIYIQSTSFIIERKRNSVEF